jgi:hypothetical protein
MPPENVSEEGIMLDQVKSGTSARIATSRPVGGGAPAGQASASARVNPPDADSATDNDKDQGRPMPEDREQQGGKPQAAPTISELSAKVLAAPAAPAARKSTDDALKRLLRDAREVMEGLPGKKRREEDVPAHEPVPMMSSLPESPFVKATSAYAQQDSLQKDNGTLRPGVVFSATFTFLFFISI